MGKFSKFIAGVLSVSMLLAVGTVSNAYASETVSFEDAISYDDIGSNNYSCNQLVDILNELIDTIDFDDFDSDEGFNGHIISVFEPEYYSYIELVFKTEARKQSMEEYVEEHGYSDIVVITVDPTIQRGHINILFSDSTIGDSDATVGDSTVTGLRGDVNLDGEVNGLDLLMLKKYIIGLIDWN